MTLGGYANRVAHVDLTAGTVTYRPIPEDWARKYVGARGLGVRYLLENGPKVDPLSPDNRLCFLNGPPPGTYEASIGTTETSELAVMLDTFKALMPTDNARAIEDSGYNLSWAPHL